MRNQKLIIVGAVIILLVSGLLLIEAGHPGNEAKTGMPMGVSGAATSVDTSKAVATSNVDIANYAFSPAVITVKAGTTVTWTNKDTVRHNVVADNGGKPDGPLLLQSQTYSYTFSKAGTYSYHCSPHPYMHGTVVVTD